MNTFLNFVNRSDDGQDKEILLFQKNVTTDMQELAIAWKVIRYCGRECYHPFVFPLKFEVSLGDDYGNFSPRLPADDGQLFAVLPTPSGRRIRCVGQSTTTREIEVLNQLPKGAVNVNIYRGGQLLAQKRSVAPQQKAVFLFEPYLWIGVASQIVQGEALDSAVLSDINTDLPLLGVASADIVMTGGGGGSDSTPYVFTLENIVMF